MNTIDVYKEEDLLKTINGKFIVEAYRCKRIGSTVIGLCENSSPMFCRQENDIPETDHSWMQSLNNQSSILKHDGQEIEYNSICPKIAWGITAYLLFYFHKIANGRLLFKVNQKKVEHPIIFDYYYELNRNYYTKANKVYYEDCEAINELAKFDKEFIEYHISQEESLINKQNTSIPDYIKDKAKEYIEWCIYKKENLDNAKDPSPKEDIKQATPNSQSFRNIIQHKDPEMFLKRLHDLIDGRSGADVGCVLLKAKEENHITRNPTKKEYESEFELIGSWSAITNYLNENKENALERANKIVFFE